MPNMANAAKAMRQARVRTQRNTVAKAEIISLRVQLRKLLADKKTAEAQTLLKTIGKKLDKAESHGVLKANTVARTKSRLTKHVNAFVNAK